MEILLLMLAFSALSMNCYAEKRFADDDREVADIDKVFSPFLSICRVKAGLGFT